MERCGGRKVVGVVVVRSFGFFSGWAIELQLCLAKGDVVAVMQGDGDADPATVNKRTIATAENLSDSTHRYPCTATWHDCAKSSEIAQHKIIIIAAAYGPAVISSQGPVSLTRVRLEYQAGTELWSGLRS